MGYIEGSQGSGGSSGTTAIRSVRVVDIILDDTHEQWERYGGWDSLGLIFWVGVEDPRTILPEELIRNLPTARPLMPHQKYYPLKGEVVLLSPSIDKIIMFTSEKTLKYTDYYFPSVNIWNEQINNAFHPTISTKGNAAGPNSSVGAADVELYKFTESGIALKNENISDSTDVPLGDYFKDINNIRPLLPYEGDYILEGRFGNSIRFGATTPFVGDSKYPQPKKNPWSLDSFNRKPTNTNKGDIGPHLDLPTGSIGDPIIIIRNGQKRVKNTLSSPLIEDVNGDHSSIYMTSNQSITNLEVATAKQASKHAIVNSDDNSATQNTYNLDLNQLDNINTLNQTPSDTLMKALESITEISTTDVNQDAANRIGENISFDIKDLQLNIRQTDQAKLNTTFGAYSTGVVAPPVILGAMNWTNESYENTNEIPYVDDDEISFYEELKKTGMTDDDFEVFTDEFGITTHNASDLAIDAEEIINEGQIAGLLKVDRGSIFTNLDGDETTNFTEFVDEIISGDDLDNSGDLPSSNGTEDSLINSNLTLTDLSENEQINYTKFETCRLLYNKDPDQKSFKKAFNYYGDLKWFEQEDSTLKVTQRAQNFIKYMISVGLYQSAHLESEDSPTFTASDGQLDIDATWAQGNVTLVIDEWDYGIRSISQLDTIPPPRNYIFPSKNNSRYLFGTATFINDPLHNDNPDEIAYINYNSFYGPSNNTGHPSSSPFKKYALMIHASGGPRSQNSFDLITSQLYSNSGIQYLNGNPSYSYIVEENGKVARISEMKYDLNHRPDVHVTRACTGPFKGNAVQMQDISNSVGNSQRVTWNEVSIHLCWMGGKDWNSDHKPTKAQSLTLISMVDFFVNKRYKSPPASVAPLFVVVGNNQTIPFGYGNALNWQMNNNRPKTWATDVYENWRSQTTAKTPFKADCPGFYVPAFCAAIKKDGRVEPIKPDNYTVLSDIPNYDQKTDSDLSLLQERYIDLPLLTDATMFEMEEFNEYVIEVNTDVKEKLALRGKAMGEGKGGSELPN